MSELHRRPLELAAASVDFELSPGEQAELAAHLASCSACRRRVDGIRQDAVAIAALPPLATAPLVSARLRDATAAGRRPSPLASLRLVAVAAILALLVLAALAVGSAVLEQDPVNLSVLPSASPAIPEPSPVPSPTVPALPSESPAATEPLEYEPPAPSCPAPPGPVSAPPLAAVVGEGEAFAPTLTSDLVSTCSTVQPGDYAAVEPETSVRARAGELMRFVLDQGWHVLQWEGFDRSRASEGANVIEGEIPDGRPNFISLRVPDRSGDVILGVTIWAATTDGRVVAMVSASVWLEVEASGPGILRTTASTACDAVGWPEGVAPYRQITFRIDSTAPEIASALSDTGAELFVLWPEGSRAGPAPDRTVLGPDGDVVARDGQTIEVPPTSAPRVGRYAVCLTPSTLHVVLDAG
jgi:hypothetical protein